MPPNFPRRTWVEIDPAALRHNLRVARAALAPGVRIMAVVKAQAYGHGLRLVVAALAGDADLFGVANVAEALVVRTVLPHAAVFLLGPVLPDERPLVVEHGFIPSLSSFEEAQAFSTVAQQQGKTLEAHLAIDTGMGRMGIWQEEAAACAEAIAKLTGLRLTGLASHLPSADEDADFTREQLARFEKLARPLRDQLFPGAALQIENSAGVLGYPAAAGDLVRPGLMLYGASPLPEMQSRLQPALTWKARVTLVREVGPGRGISYGRTFITPHAMRIATLGVGYADGYQRHLSHRGAEVLLGGRRCPVLGRVTMDQILVDVSGVPGAAEGDEAVLLGRQGQEEVPAAELAAKAGTIPWEIFTGIGPRVERFSQPGPEEARQIA